ncbi:MaoC/PaaZ C-terminal domain-containing protein [Polaribacter sp.]|nr:MaoC/PaaZ C-terminal domain-containing protein [Polaribacter sp.]
MILNINDEFEEFFVVSKETQLDFIKLSQDRNPLHTNEEFAISKGFKGEVMHGNILNAFLSFFIGECLPTKDVIIHSQDIQFKNPVYLNSKLKFTASVSGVFESVKAVEFKYYFRNSELKVVAKGKIQIGII